MTAPLNYDQTRLLVRQVTGFAPGSEERTQALRTLEAACDFGLWWEHSDEPEGVLLDIVNAAIAQAMGSALLPLLTEADIPPTILRLADPNNFLARKAIAATKNIVLMLQRESI